MLYGLYIHVPFCRKKCGYCGFYSVPLENREILALYVKKLLAEIRERLIPFKGDAADTIFFGGGTPSLLDPEIIKKILDEVRGGINLAQNTEISLEVNPEDVHSDRLSGYLNAGVNRFVLGLQTSSERLHEIIMRSPKLCDKKTLEAFFKIKGAVRCLDLMTGIPGETWDELFQDIETALRFEPEHISAYLLTLESGTRLAESFVPGPEFSGFQREAFEKTVSLLKSRGYIHYEISNFCLPGFECRHNMKYWNYEPYIGFGPSAHSFFHGERFMNRMSAHEYLTADKFSLTRDERSKNSSLVEFIMTKLRLLKGFSREEFRERLGLDIPEPVMERIMGLSGKGLLEISHNRADINVRLTTEGLYLADSVIYEAVEPLL